MIANKFCIMDLQKELIESTNQKGRRGWRATTASLTLHGLLLAGVIYAGTHEVAHKVAAEKPIPAFITQGAAPPPPPPPPPPPAPASGGAPQQATPKVQPKPVDVPPDPMTPPVEVPKEVPKVDMPVSRDLPVANNLSEVPSSGGDQGAGDAVAGVPGGVAGGVAGGVVGGEVGGVVGGEIGGVKGGEIGGVLGGKVGGTGTGTEGEGSGGNDAPPDGPLRVGGDVKAPVVVSRAEPDYTEPARKARVSGIVVVEAIIDKNGRVQQVKVVKDLPMGLSEQAAEAVKRWRFKPGTLNGQPVATIFNLTVNFKLN